MSPVQFAMAFEQSPNSLCTEMVAAWAQRSGRVSVISKYSQRRLMLVAGAEKGLEIIASKFGVSETTDPAVGDVVLMSCQDGARVVGVYCGNGLSVAAQGGGIHVGPFVIHRSWRLS